MRRLFATIIVRLTSSEIKMGSGEVYILDDRDGAKMEPSRQNSNMFSYYIFAILLPIMGFLQRHYSSGCNINNIPQTEISSSILVLRRYFIPRD